jgi:hypothetical protein
MGSQHRFRAHFLEAADVARVPAVLLVFQLSSGELHLGGVDDDDVIPNVQVRAEAGFVLTAEDGRDARGQASQHLSLGVHDVPLPLDVALPGHRRRHAFPFDRAKYA